MAVTATAVFAGFAAAAWLGCSLTFLAFFFLGAAAMLPSAMPEDADQELQGRPQNTEEKEGIGIASTLSMRETWPAMTNHGTWRMGAERSLRYHA